MGFARLIDQFHFRRLDPRLRLTDFDSSDGAGGKGYLIAMVMELVRCKQNEG